SLSSRSKAMVVAGVGSAWTNRSRSRVPRASKPESCMTRGSKVVVNRVLVGVGWIIEGLRVGVKAYVSTISPKVPLLSNLLFPLPVLVAGKSAITPFQSVAQICREVRKALPAAQIILIGSYAQYMPSHAADTCPVDVIVTESCEVAGIPAALDLYQDGFPPFTALRLEPKTAVIEIKAALEKQIHDFAFFEEDICVDDGEPLIEIIQMTEPLHKYARFHAICGLDPQEVT